MLIIRSLNLISVQSLTYLVFHGEVDITGNLCYVEVVSASVPVLTATICFKILKSM